MLWDLYQFFIWQVEVAPTTLIKHQFLIFSYEKFWMDADKYEQMVALYQ